MGLFYKEDNMNGSVRICMIITKTHERTILVSLILSCNKMA